MVMFTYNNIDMYIFHYTLFRITMDWFLNSGMEQLLYIEVKVCDASDLILTWMIADVISNSSNIAICIVLINRNVVPLL